MTHRAEEKQDGEWTPGKAEGDHFGAEHPGLLLRKRECDGRGPNLGGGRPDRPEMTRSWPLTKAAASSPRENLTFGLPMTMIAKRDHRQGRPTARQERHCRPQSSHPVRASA